MELLYILNLALAICLVVAPIFWSRHLLRLPWVNPVSLQALCGFPIEIFRLLVGQLFRDDGLMAPSYQFAVLMTNLQQSIGLLLLWAASHQAFVRHMPNLLPRMGFYRRRDLARLPVIFFLLYAAAFLVLATKTGGVTDWLMDIRGSYIQKREGNGIYYAAAVSFLSVSYFFAGLASTSSKRFTMLSLLYFAAIYVLGSKGFVLQFFIYYLIIVWRQGQFPISRMMWIALPSAFALLLLNFFSQRESVDFESIAEYFDYYPNAAMYYADYFSGAVKLFDGQVLLSSLWEYVPRGLFPDKPYVYGILQVVEIYYPGGAESGNTPAFFGGVPQFADFGFTGVILFALLSPTPWILFAGLRYALRDGHFLQTEGFSGRAIVISLLLFAPAFGTFLPMGMLAMLLLLVLTIIRCARMLAFRPHNPRRIET